MQVQMNIPKIKDRLEDSLLVAHVAQQANHLKQPCCFKLKHMADQVWRQNSLEDSIYHYPQVSISYKQFFFIRTHLSSEKYALKIHLQNLFYARCRAE